MLASLQVMITRGDSFDWLKDTVIQAMRLFFYTFVYAMPLTRSGTALVTARGLVSLVRETLLKE
jgi:hypothetical protein